MPAIASRSQATGAEVVRHINEAGGDAVWIHTDVSQPAQVEAMVASVLSTFGRLDVAFNNACGSGGHGGWLAEIAEEDWDRTIDGYLKSVFLCMKHEIQAMLENAGTENRAIVNNSSVDGQPRAFPFDPIYSGRQARRSRPHQVRRRPIRKPRHPHQRRLPRLDPHASYRRSPGRTPRSRRPVAHAPTNRPASALPMKSAQAVLWLCSPQASLVTATALAVDGGYLAV